MLGCLAAHAENHELPSEKRQALVAEANKALNAYVKIELKDRDGDNIPKNLWGPAITALKPLRVVNDHLNVKIVMSDAKENETGFYVTISISSYRPMPGTFAEFEPLSRPEDKTAILGEVYRYRLILKKR
jgi:hypothetical protein